MEFIDAQQMAREHPDTFEVLSLEELYKDVWLGDYLKVCTNSERFWVEVIAVDGDYITTKVANNLSYTELKLHQEVIINFRHIYQRLPANTETTKTEEGNMENICPGCN